MLTVTEVAERLGVSSKTVTRLITEGKLKAYRFGNHYRIEENDLNEFIEQSKVTPNQE